MSNLETIESKITAVQAPAMSQQQLQERIATLEAQVRTAQESRFPLHGIDQADGSTKSVQDTIAESRALTEESEMILQRNKREREDSEQRLSSPGLNSNGELIWIQPKKIDPPVFKDRDECQAFARRSGWENLTPQQRAEATDIRTSEVAAYDPAKYFGRTSNSALASELMKANPVMYALVKLRSKKLNIF